MLDIKNNFCLIPPSIWKHPELSLTEKCLLGRIYSLSSEKGYCYAGNNYLAEEISKSAKTISRVVSKLVEKGFLIREVSRNNNNQIEERRLKINEIGIKLVYQQKEQVVWDTPMLKNEDTYAQNWAYPMLKNEEERVDVRKEDRKDINIGEKKSKKQNDIKITKEHNIVLAHYNSLFRKNRPSKSYEWVANYDVWRKTYSVDEILLAITNWHKYDHWSKSNGQIPSLVLLFRTRNKSGEANYIDEMLSKDLSLPKPKQKHPDAIAFDLEWEAYDN